MLLERKAKFVLTVLLSNFVGTIKLHNNYISLQLSFIRFYNVCEEYNNNICICI